MPGQPPCFLSFFIVKKSSRQKVEMASKNSTKNRRQRVNQEPACSGVARLKNMIERHEWTPTHDGAQLVDRMLRRCWNPARDIVDRMSLGRRVGCWMA
jgi:hypothetical protein